jgi:hypothetical protein
MLDPGDSFVRVRAIFTILQASGHYFIGGNAHGKLKQFFTFLQRYLLLKEDLPADLAATFHQLHSKLLPDCEFYATYEEADKAVRSYLAKEDNQVGAEAGAAEDDASLDNLPDADRSVEAHGSADAAPDDHDGGEPADDELYEKELANLFPEKVCTLHKQARTESVRRLHRAPVLQLTFRVICCSQAGIRGWIQWWQKLREARLSASEYD